MKKEKTILFIFFLFMFVLLIFAIYFFTLVGCAGSKYNDALDAYSYSTKARLNILQKDYNSAITNLNLSNQALMREHLCCKITRQ